MSAQQYQQAVGAFDYDAYTIRPTQFEAWMQEKDTVVIDLRLRKEYDAGHIKGAKHLGADIDAEALATLVPSKKTRILFYCSNAVRVFPSRSISLTVASAPQAHLLGYTNSYYLQDGYAAQDDAENAAILRLLPPRPNFFP